MELNHLPHEQAVDRLETQVVLDHVADPDPPWPCVDRGVQRPQQRRVGDLNFGRVRTETILPYPLARRGHPQVAHRPERGHPRRNIVAPDQQRAVKEAHRGIVPRLHRPDQVRLAKRRVGKAVAQLAALCIVEEAEAVGRSGGRHVRERLGLETRAQLVMEQ